VLNNVNILCDNIISYYEVNKDNLNNNLLTIEKKIDLHKYIYIKLKYINNLYGIAFCSYSDLFLLRRILDKEYIKNSIIYCGKFHMWEIAYYLIKYFNFKLTNISYANDSNELGKIKKINHLFNTIKYDDPESLEFLQNFFNQRNQCSNLFTFPDNIL
jgi:hypothetical protein